LLDEVKHFTLEIIATVDWPEASANIRCGHETSSENMLLVWWHAMVPLFYRVYAALPLWDRKQDGTRNKLLDMFSFKHAKLLMLLYG